MTDVIRDSAPGIADRPSPTGSLTPAQHIDRGRELIREVERARARGYDDASDIALWQADSMLAMAHFSSAVATEQLRLIEEESNPAREVPSIGPEAAVSAATHERAAQLAENHLPDYLGAFLAGTLRQHHSLPALVEHQDQLAEDLIRMLSSLDAKVEAGSVDHVVAKLESIGIARGGATRVYVERDGVSVPVANVRYEPASKSCAHPELDGACPQGCEITPHSVVISG